jgi:hypothetical protein
MNETNIPITPRNMDLKISEIDNKPKCESKNKENQLYFFEKWETPENIRIIRKINNMICKWVVKYKFHTKSIRCSKNSLVKKYVTEFSNPSSYKPIPEATAIVNLKIN